MIGPLRFTVTTLPQPLLLQYIIITIIIAVLFVVQHLIIFDCAMFVRPWLRRRGLVMSCGSWRMMEVKSSSLPITIERESCDSSLPLLLPLFVS